MKKVSYVVALIILSATLWGGSLSAQDKGTYIDNASPQDSSMVEGDKLNLDEKSQSASSGSTIRIIGAAAIVVGAVVVFVIRKKRKK